MNKRIPKAVLIAIVAVALIGGVVLGAHLFTKDVPVDVTVIPSGGLLVTPGTLSFGERLQDETIPTDFFFENTSDESLSVTWDTTILSNEDTILTVGTASMGTTLGTGESKTLSILFRVEADAPYAEYTDLMWYVYGETT